MIIITDGNGCVVPLCRSASGGYRRAEPTLTLPLRCAPAIGVQGTLSPTTRCQRLAIVAMTFESSTCRLMRAILSVDIHAVDEILTMLSESEFART
jgi:hypothetical protein